MFNGTDIGDESSGSKISTILGGIGATFGCVLTVGLALKCIYSRYSSKSHKTEKNTIKLSPTGVEEFIQTEVSTSLDNTRTNASADAQLNVKAHVSLQGQNSSSDQETKEGTNNKDDNSSVVQKLVSLVTGHSSTTSAKNAQNHDIENPSAISLAFINLLAEISKKEDADQIFTNAMLILRSVGHVGDDKITSILSLIRSEVSNSSTPPLTKHNTSYIEISESRTPHHGKLATHHKRSHSHDLHHYKAHIRKPIVIQSTPPSPFELPSVGKIPEIKEPESLTANSTASSSTAQKKDSMVIQEEVITSDSAPIRLLETLAQEPSSSAPASPLTHNEDVCIAGQTDSILG